ncbi:MAG: DNA polymerase III subunit delta [Candidatus Kapabacteria bacterium]|nr:DNA polymerase III subunit delta [Candidatus Kapabacteria bacterium]
MIDEILRSGNFPPAILLFGEEDFLVEHGAQRLFDAAAKQDATGMNTDVLDGEQTSLDAVLSIARSFPMMSDRRVVWVRRAEKLSARESKGSDALGAYLADPSAATVLLFTATIAAADGIGRLRQRPDALKKKLSKVRYPLNRLIAAATWDEYPRQSEAQVRSWMGKYSSSLGLVLPAEAPDLLMAKVGTGLREIAMELDKLQIYVGQGGAATLEDVHRLAGSTREFNVFELQRAIGRRDAPSALRILNAMLEADSQEIMILTMLARHFTSLYALIDLRGVNDPSVIARQSGLQPFAVTEAFQHLEALGPRRIEQALHHIRQAERALRSSSDKRLTMEIMVCAIIDADEPTPSRIFAGAS